MAAAVTGSAVTNATTVTLPAHNIGDVIVIFAGRLASATVPSVPSAAGTVPTWITIDSRSSGTSTPSGITVYAIATATNHTSGTWTNANGTLAVVVSGASASPIGGHGTSITSTTTTTTAAPSITMSVTDGSSVLLHFYAHSSMSGWGAAPAGYTLLQSTVSAGMGADSKNVTTSDGSVTHTISASGSGNWGGTVEILASGGGGGGGGSDPLHFALLGVG